MKNLEPLIIFARVAEMKSFTQAAESLGIPHSYPISKAVRWLKCCQIFVPRRSLRFLLSRTGATCHSV